MHDNSGLKTRISTYKKYIKAFCFAANIRSSDERGAKMKVIDPILTGRKLKKMCLEKGLTVTDIQIALNLDFPQSIYKWFSDKSQTIPSLDHSFIVYQSSFALI